MVITLISYLIGCFSGAYYYGTLFRNKDLRKYGSGNLGALNSGRVLGKQGFIVVLLIDSLKGVLVVALGRYFGLSNTGLIIAMLAVILGHIFPLQLNFKGGKGVATFVGTVTAYNYLFTIIMGITFIPIFIIIRRFTISGLISILLFPLIILFLGYPGSEVFAMLLFAAIIILGHRENINKFFGITK